MKLDEVRKRISDAGMAIVSEGPIQHGQQLRLANGQIVNVYESGKLVFQGKNTDAAQRILAEADGAVTETVKPANGNNRNVFVVYGHDTAARNELEAMLRRWGLEPLIFEQLPSAGQTIIEKLETVRAQAHFAVVLATPDDEGHRANQPGEKLLRTRQNVVLELGMMLAVLGRPKVAIVMPSSAQMERPSDIQGLIYISYKEKVEEAGLTLAKEMASQGMPINWSKI